MVVRIAPVNGQPTGYFRGYFIVVVVGVRFVLVPFLQGECHAESRRGDGYIGGRTAGIPYYKELWDRARDRCAVAQHHWEPGRRTANDRWGKHHLAHESVREDTGG